MVTHTSDEVDINFVDAETGLQVVMHSKNVPVDDEHPEGIRYSFVIIKDGVRLLGYDNFGGHLEHGRHHKHIGERIIAYQFMDVWKLCEDFSHDWERTRKEHARG
jgi:hypothetical protein